ncbi:hypothetical protein [Megamonas sp.]
MGMVLNFIGVLSIIVLIGCILFIIYKLIRHGKQSLNLNYFLGIVICVLFFVISIEAGKFYPTEDTIWQKIIQVTNTETERAFDEAEELQKIMTGVDLTEEEAWNVINTFKQCGFEEIYFNGENSKLDEKYGKGYTFKYKDKIINAVIDNSGHVWVIFSGDCYFYEYQHIQCTRKDWYISEEEKEEMKEKALNNLEKYAKNKFSNTNDWQVLKIWQENKGYLISSLENEIYVYFLPNKQLDTIIIKNEVYYTRYKK